MVDIKSSSASASGGAIACEESTVNIQDHSKISFSTAAQNGGTLMLENCNSIIADTTIHEGSAGINGGNLYCSSSKVTLQSNSHLDRGRALSGNGGNMFLG